MTDIREAVFVYDSHDEVWLRRFNDTIHELEASSK